MSMISENSLVCFTPKLSDVIKALEKNPRITNIMSLFHDKDYAVLTFDSNGDVIYFDEKDWLKPEQYFILEHVNLQWDETDKADTYLSDKGLHQLPMDLAYLINSKFIFPEITKNQRKTLIQNLRYTSWDNQLTEGGTV